VEVAKNLRHQFSYRNPASHNLRVLWLMLSRWETLCWLGKVHHKHITQYYKFQGILEFVGNQLVTSSMIFSEPPTHSPEEKQHAY